MKKNNRKNGFMTLIGILIVVAIMSIWFVKVYSTPKTPDGKTQMDTYTDAIKDAENAKALMEAKQIEN